MNILKNSWRRSLLAVAVVALLVPVSGDGVSDNATAAEPAVLAGLADLSTVVGFTAMLQEEREEAEERERDQAEERERDEAEEREKAEERERDQAEERERDKRRRDRDRPREGERRERPDRERGEREHAERERGEREHREHGERAHPEREILQHQLEVIRMAVPALREAERMDALELLERAVRAREVTLEGRRDDEAHQIRERGPDGVQLAEILAMASGIWREFGDQQKAAALGELAEQLLRGAREREHQAHREHEARRERGERGPEQEAAKRAERIMRRRGELEEHGQNLERELEGLRDGREERAHELRGALKQVGEELRELAAAEQELRQGMPKAASEQERRMQHIRAAVENLEAAGLHDQARRLLHEAEQMQRGRPDPGRRHPGPPRPEGHRGPDGPHGEHPDARQRAEHVERTVAELCRKMEELQAQVTEMREFLKKNAQR